MANLESSRARSIGMGSASGSMLSAGVPELSDGQDPARQSRRDATSRVYLDHAATTPILPEALEAMVAELAKTGNPSSLHNAGRRARRVIEESREQIAQTYGARPSEVVFTSGGTEADNLAIKGLYWARRGVSPRRRKVLITAI